MVWWWLHCAYTSSCHGVRVGRGQLGVSRQAHAGLHFFGGAAFFWGGCISCVRQREQPRSTSEDAGVQRPT